MLKTRIIPCRDVADGRVVKGARFTNIIDAGHAGAVARAHDSAFNLSSTLDTLKS